jgi:hypothetical protein
MYLIRKAIFGILSNTKTISNFRRPKTTIMKRFIYLSLILVSCSTTQKAVQTQLKDDQTFLLTKVSNDPEYGFSDKKPVEVGGVDKQEGPKNERRFLNALAGPNGEKIKYNRINSCCSFKTENGFMGKGLLDVYSVTWEGSTDTLELYINMYDYGELKAPVGFTIKK